MTQNQKAIVLDTPEMIEHARLLTLRSMLALEIKTGMKRSNRGRAASTIIRELLGSKSRQKEVLLKELDYYIINYRAKHGILPKEVIALGPEMRQRIHHMAHSTWDAIGGDVLHCKEEMGEDPVMDREEVIEVVCDADHMQVYGHDPEAYATFQSLPDYDTKLALLRTIFTYESYSW